MSWEDVENAMHAAIVLASGYPSDRVTWSYQNVNEPALDHAVITFGGEIQIGQDWVRYNQDLNRVNGQEIRQDIHGVREVPFRVEVFTTDTTGGAAARRVAELVRTKLRLPSVRILMRRAGVSPFDSDPVQWVPDIPTARFRGRAVLSIRCYLPVMDCFEYAGYIARIKGTVYPTGFVATGLPSGLPFDTDNA